MQPRMDKGVEAAGETWRGLRAPTSARAEADCARRPPGDDGRVASRVAFATVLARALLPAVGEAAERAHAPPPPLVAVTCARKGDCARR